MDIDSHCPYLLSGQTTFHFYIPYLLFGETTSHLTSIKVKGHFSIFPPKLFLNVGNSIKREMK